MLGKPNRKTIEEAKEALFTNQTTVVRDQSFSVAELGAELPSAPEYSPHSKSLLDAFQAVEAASKKKASASISTAIPASPVPEKRSVYSGFGSLFSRKPSVEESKKAEPTVPAAKGFKGPNSSQGG